MPRYQITAPDGRVVVIEGDRPPTSTDAQRIFANLPVDPNRRKTAERSGMEQDRELLKSTAGRDELTKRAEAGEPRARGNIGLLSDIALEGGGATAGQALGALAAPYTFGASVPIGGALGGAIGNYASQKRRVLAGEQTSVMPGQILSSALTGAIPGASLESAGARSMVREGAKQAAGGVAGRALETMVDEGRLPSGTEVAITSALPAIGGAVGQRLQSGNSAVQAAVADAATENATRRATLAAGRGAGYVLPPSQVNPSALTNTLESIGGKAAMGQEAAIRNQRVTNRLAKEALGIPENVDITETVLEGIRAAEARPYQAIGQLADRARTDLDALLQSTQASSAHQTAANQAVPAVADRIRSLSTIAAADVNALRDARFRANQGFRHYERSADPDALTAARSAQAEADALETAIEQAAVEAGTPQVVDQLRAARQRIAQTYDVERALNLGDANVSAPIIGKALDKGKPLSGPLATIGEFAEAFPSAVREGSKVPTPGVSALLPIGAVLSGAAGNAAFGPAGMALAAAPFARGPVRSLLLSEPYQNYATRIPLSVDARPPLGAVSTRTLAQEAAQEIAEESSPKKKDKK